MAIVTNSASRDKAIRDFNKSLGECWEEGLSTSWGGRGDSRDFRIWRTLIGLVQERGKDHDEGWTVKVSRRDLAEATGTRSKRGLEVSLNRLVKAGWIKILSRGAGDRHCAKAGNSKGHRANFLIVRHRGSTQEVQELNEYQLTDVLPSQKKRSPSPYRPPVPDNSTDLAVKEPMLLRMMDLVRAGLVEAHGWTAARLAEVLGISRQSAWEAMKRWEEFSVWGDGTIYVEDFQPTYESNDEHRDVIDREEACRKKALDGNWSPRRARCGRRLNGLVCNPFVPPVKRKPTPPPEPFIPVDPKVLLDLQRMALGLSDYPDDLTGMR